jgi:hypothetical protein
MKSQKGPQPQERRQNALDYIFNDGLDLLHKLGLTDTIDMHAGWLNDYLSVRPDEELTLMAHRESYKTSVISVGMALDLILTPRLGLGFFRKTDTDVSDVIRAVAKHLTNPLLIQLSDMLWGFPVKITKQTETEIDTNYHLSRLGEPALRASGINGSLTGKHYDKIITDDIVNKEDRYSAAKRENTKSFCFELKNVLNRGGRRVNSCTPWYKTDATQSFKGVKKYPVGSTGLFTAEQIDIKKRSMPKALFAINYDLDLAAANESLFAGITELPDWVQTPQYPIFAYLDPSQKGKDYTALCVGTMVFDRLRIVGFAYKKPWFSIFDSGELEQIVKSLGVTTLSIETNGVGDIPVKMAREISGKKLGGALRCLSVNNTAPKIARIQTAAAFSHSIDIVEFDDLPESREWKQQVVDYDASAEHDDAPDSLAGLMESMKIIRVKK